MRVGFGYLLFGVSGSNLETDRSFLEERCNILKFKFKKKMQTTQKQQTSDFSYEI